MTGSCPPVIRFEQGCDIAVGGVDESRHSEDLLLGDGFALGRGVSAHYHLPSSLRQPENRCRCGF